MAAAKRSEEAAAQAAELIRGYSGIAGTLIQADEDQKEMGKNIEAFLEFVTAKIQRAFLGGDAVIISLVEEIQPRTKMAIPSINDRFIQLVKENQWTCGKCGKGATPSVFFDDASRRIILQFSCHNEIDRWEISEAITNSPRAVFKIVPFSRIPAGFKAPASDITSLSDKQRKILLDLSRATVESPAGLIREVVRNDSIDEDRNSIDGILKALRNSGLKMDLEDYTAVIDPPLPKPLVPPSLIIVQGREVITIDTEGMSFEQYQRLSVMANQNPALIIELRRNGLLRVDRQSPDPSKAPDPHLIPPRESDQRTINLNED